MTAERGELRQLRRKVKQSELEREILVKAAACYRIATMCRMLEVSRSGYYARLNGEPKEAPPAGDLVKRDFTATGPNQLWVADITYVPTWAIHLRGVRQAVRGGSRPTFDRFRGRCVRQRHG